MLLANIALFLKIVEKGGLAAAGREVGLSSTTVSERLAALETHFGVVLLNRTTRAISLTDEGRTLLEGAKMVLRTWKRASVWVLKPCPGRYGLALLVISDGPMYPPLSAVF